jgi:aspartyl-tRNA(Asn)/glutamyl-tRNA(Gln) amidotransferase subunit B
MTATNAPHKGAKFIKGATGDWEVVIGMEVHAQVTSRSKLFSGAATAFGGEPNSQVSLVDAAMPGMLPVINEECIKQAVRTGLGLKASINPKSVFDRKNYFYPDLPQGYQISQYKSPVVGEGEVVLDMADGETVTVGIERLHLEQDAGKLLHDRHAAMSLVDLNRSGVALMEIVSKPDLRSAEQAMTYVAKLRTIMRYLGTCDGDMEKGNLRADVNVSVRKPGAVLGTRCEIKNLNSIRFIGQAIEHEARRQISILEDGGKIDQETRLFDSNKGKTRSMRDKEEAHDYRYFPDPDLLPLELDAAYIEDLKAHLPELPDATKACLMQEYGRSAYQAEVLVAEKARANYYKAMVKAGADREEAANWLINEYLGRLDNEAVSLPNQPTGPIESSGAIGITGPTAPSWPTGTTPTGPSSPMNRGEVLGPIGPAANTEIVRMTSTGQISRRMAKDLLGIVIRLGQTNDPQVVIHLAIDHGLERVTEDSAVEKLVDDILRRNPEKVEQAKAKPAMIGWFVGQVIKSSGGKANPQTVNDLFKAKLGVG